MMYRYTISRSDWLNTDDDWQQLLDYVRTHFSYVVMPNDETLYFNATPAQLRQAASTLRIGTVGFMILTTSKLEPSIHEA